MPDGVLKQDLFHADDIVKDIADSPQRNAYNLYIVDLFKTKVLHFKDDEITGTLDSQMPRPEGPTVANWRIARIKTGLLFDVEVFDTEIRATK